MNGRILCAMQEGMVFLRMEGEIRFNLCTELDIFVDQLFQRKDWQSILIDLTTVSVVDSTALGILAKISIQTRQQQKPMPVLAVHHPDVREMIMAVGFDKVFNVIDKPQQTSAKFTELSHLSESDRAMTERVIKAHKTLMTMSDKNQVTFKEVVSTLEKGLTHS